MLKGFKDFIMRGNVIDLAVAVVIGAAFTAVVNSIVVNIFNPLIGALFKADSLNEAFNVPIGDATIKFGAVVGAIVAEISLGRSGGIGRLTFEYSRAATSDPAKVYVALVGAAALGLAMALLVGVVDALASRGRQGSPA